MFVICAMLPIITSVWILKLARQELTLAAQSSARARCLEMIPFELRNLSVWGVCEKRLPGVSRSLMMA